jgi:hypothetical protein
MIEAILNSGDIFANVTEFLFTKELEILGMTCRYLQFKVASVPKVKCRRRFPSMYTRTPLFQLPTSSPYAIMRRARLRQKRQHQSMQHQFYTFLQKYTKCPFFHGLAGRLFQNGYLFQDDQGDWVYSMQTETFNIQWMDTTSNIESSDDDDVEDDRTSPRLYHARLDEPPSSCNVASSSCLIANKALAEAAEVSVLDWTVLYRAMCIQESLRAMCDGFMKDSPEEPLVLQGAFPVLIQWDNSLSSSSSWTAADLHARLIPRSKAKASSSIENNDEDNVFDEDYFGLAFDPGQCIFSECAFMDWYHIGEISSDADADDDNDDAEKDHERRLACTACARRRQQAWPPREVMLRWFLPHENSADWLVDDDESEVDVSGGPEWRQHIFCVGLFGLDQHWDSYTRLPDGSFVCQYCVRQGFIADPLAYQACPLFLTPLKKLLTSQLEQVQMLTYVDGQALSVHIFGGLYASQYWVGVVTFEAMKEVVMNRR